MSGSVDKEALARRIAQILGPSSAAAQALAELIERRKVDPSCHIINNGRAWLVSYPRTTPKPKP